MIYNHKITPLLYGYFITRMGMRDYTRGWLKGDCPSCGKLDKYGVNLSQDRSNCFSCGYNKKPASVIMEAESISTRVELWLYLKAFDGVAYLSPERYTPKKVVKELELPESFTLVGFNDCLISKAVNKYLKSRGFRLSTLMGLGWGYCTTGNFKGRLIIPYYAGGKLVYYTARKLFTSGEKFKNISFDEAGIGKTSLIYNIDALAVYDKIWVTESATNSVTIGDMGIATGGKSISPYQLSQIIKSPATRIIIALDPDAMIKAYNLGLQLCRHKQVKVLRFPDGEDVNSVGKSEAIKLEKSMDYQSRRELFSLLNDERRLSVDH